MTDHDDLLPSSFQPWNRTSAEPKSFEAALGRIYAERGHFRHLTEAQLRAEVAANTIAGAPSPADSDLEEQEGKDTAGNKSRVDLLAQSRRDAIEHVASAQNEALLALDFVSLLLSKDVKQAESTISPILKQSVPPGTLGLDMWEGMNTDVRQQEKDRLLARGKRMECLAQSADALMAAGDRLKTTVDRERKYWDEVLRVREQGWSVCRMPRERGVLGVRYGFPEAQGEFARRGLAALKMGDGGDVVLDRGLGTDTKALRVRILEDGVVKGESSTSLYLNDHQHGHMDVEARIRSARDSLFEEELWHEAMRESRLLGSYGVKMKGNTISLPSAYLDTQDTHLSGPLVTIEVDLVSERDKNQSASVPSVLANGIATALRLLLSHNHRTRLEKRSTIPPPMSSTKTDKHVASLLRPLLSALHHKSALEKLTNSLSSTTQLLGKAGITTSQTLTYGLTAKLDTCQTAPALLAAFCQPQSTELKLTVSLPTPASGTQAPLDLTITTSTWLSPPTARGTTFTFHSPALPSFQRNTSSLSVLAEHITAALQHALTDAVGAWLPNWERDTLVGRVERPVLRRTGGVDSIGVRLGADSLVVSAREEEVTWTADGGKDKDFGTAVGTIAERIA